MTDGWMREHELAGRDVCALDLGGGARARLPGPRSLAVLLSGRAFLAGSEIASGSPLFAPGAEILAGSAGCRLGAVRWDGDPPSSPVTVESTTSRHFEKYESFQARMTVREGDRDLLAAWELYRVRMLADATEQVQLHVHHVVTNLLFMPGDTGCVRGHLIVARAGHVTATTLVSGDLAVVRPGIHHHVVPLRASDPVEMVVLNDASSAYEEPDRADFHLVGTVPWHEVEVLPRPDRRPRLHVVA